MSSANSEKNSVAAKKRLADDRAADKEVITSLMRTVVGRRWIWNQLSFAQIFVGDEMLDPYVMAFKKGQRNTGLRLLQDVNRFAPDMYVRMVQENSGVKLEEDSNGGTDSSLD